MKKLLFIFSYFISIIAYGSKVNQCMAQEPAQEPEMTFEELVTWVMQLYQNVDPQLAEERNETYLLTLKHITPEGENNEKANAFFLNNIAHIDEVANQAIKFAKEKNIAELAVLLDTELLNFYAHPHNTIDNELILHTFLAELYYFTSNSYEEYIRRVISLDSYSVAHMEASEDRHPDYHAKLIDLTCNCIDIGEYEKAIAYGEKLRAYTVEVGEVESQIYASLFLAKAYEKAGNTKQQKAIIDSIKEFPQYAKCCEDMKQLAIFAD